MSTASVYRDAPPAVVEGGRTTPWAPCWLASVNGIRVVYDYDRTRRALIYRLPGGDSATANELAARGIALRLPDRLRPGVAPALEG